MKKIIIVDDNVNFVDMAREYLENFTGKEVIAFYTPDKVLEHISNHKDIDVLVSDYEMPKMNGFELAKQVLEKSPNIKIIIWSGHDQITLEEVNEKYNINAKFLSKDEVKDVVKLISES